MPVFDRKCESCDWLTDFALEPVTDPHPVCPSCGGSTTRYMAGHGPMVIPDTYSTPIVDSVMTNKKQVHYSRSERKAAMKHNRLQEFIKWVPGAESDKSSLCGRTDAVGAAQIEKWKQYFLEKFPLTDEEKARQLVLTD